MRVLLAVLVTACSAERTRPVSEPCTSWREDVAPVFQARCASCHAELGEYPGALAEADRLVGVLDASDPNHAAVADVRPLVESWVDQCGLSYFRSDLHPGGIMNPADPAFHGATLRELGWDFAFCASCHGEDFAGGAAGSSCLGCHTEGPTACTTCHGVPPASGAHAAHASRAPCETCHVVPAAWDAPGHLDDPPAEASCTGACHLSADPDWYGGPGEAACGTCHGVPPATHAPGACTTCHAADAPHVDGVVDVGFGLAGCSSCHGDAESAAPTDGGHRSHVFASRLRGPVPCADCHLVPTETRSAGHIDTAPPAEVTHAGWSAATDTCTGVACHGDAVPRWTEIGMGWAACGTCHGIPPTSAPHQPTFTLMDCASCHPDTVDGFGNILIVGGASEHIDGEVDL